MTTPDGDRLARIEKRLDWIEYVLEGNLNWNGTIRSQPSAGMDWRDRDTVLRETIRDEMYGRGGR